MDGRPPATARARDGKPDLQIRTEAVRQPGQTRARLLAVIAAVLVLAFLKWSQVATMPIGFAVFVIALAWPLQERFERQLPRWASFTLTILALLAAVALLFGTFYWSGSMLAEEAPRYAGRLQQLYGQLAGWARGHGISLGAQGFRGFTGQAARFAGQAVSTGLSLILLILALTILGLLEVHRYKRRLEHGFRDPERGRRVVETSRVIATKIQQYFLARTLTSILQGVVVGLFALLMGLDFAFVWGLIAFLLNYIPSVGSALSILPPSLFALVQFQGLGRPLAVFLGMSVIQIVLGNYVEPLIEGRYVSLSPVVVLASIVFWGWVWGLGGALLGVPLTVGLVIAADHFDQTRWIANLLAERPADRKKGR
jgi:predicted PurR-regulated permease PerM